MTQPLTPSEVREILTPNPASWGQDGYPAGFSLFGLPVIVNPDLDPDTFRLVQEPPPERP